MENIYLKNKLSEYEEYFSNIDGKSLDREQKIAILNDSDAQLIIAGAGSGKTMTIAAKTFFLVNVEKIDPSQILLISFTNKGVEELRKRVVENLKLPVEIETFHSLGMKIIAQARGKKPSVQEKTDEIILRYIQNMDSQQFSKIIHFLSLYLYQSPNFQKFETLGDYYSVNSHVSFNTLKSIFLEHDFMREDYKFLDKKILLLILLYLKEYRLSFHHKKNEVETFLREFWEEIKNEEKDSIIDKIVTMSSSKKEYNEEIEKHLKEKYSLLNREELNDFLWNKKQVTYKGERVKSWEELIIANTLFVNGIEYEYEKEYPYDTRSISFRQYRPDFYLPEYDIYLEHFALDEKGMPSLPTSEIEKTKYLESFKWKREIHKKYNTKLIETYSYYDNIIKKLKEILFENGIEFKPISISEFLLHQNYMKEKSEFKEFFKIIKTFLKLYKNSQYDNNSSDCLKSHFKGISESFDDQRLQLFFEIFDPFYQFYQNQLKISGSIDFEDMIGMAIKHLDEIKRSDINYRYILIDEYQDISYSRYELIKKLKEKTKSKLIAIGDDWQTIYRFSGSNINLILNFEYYFKNAKTAILKNNYRNPQSLLEVSGEFIMKNPWQLKKNLEAQKDIEKSIQIIGYKEDKVVALTLGLEKILKENSNKTVFLLGRNKEDLNFLYKSSYFSIREEKGVKIITTPLYPVAKIKFLTVHSSKGLEADEVIILNCEDSITGFPNKISDDKILSSVLTSSEEFLYAEERRVFYVALTRSKNHCIILSPIANTSIFVKELIEQGVYYEQIESVDTVKCPRCKTGNLLSKKSSSGGFFYCSHYPQCTFINKKSKIGKKPIICPWCGGVMVLRKGKLGNFLGCSNYPYCKNIQSDISNFAHEDTENSEIPPIFKEEQKINLSIKLSKISQHKDFSILSPYQLGETHNKKAYTYLRKFLEEGDENEKRLATEAVEKLYKSYPDEALDLKPIILKNALTCNNQIRLYSLKVLLLMVKYLTREEIKIIFKIFTHRHCDEYTEKIIIEIHRRGRIE